MIEIDNPHTMTKEEWEREEDKAHSTLDAGSGGRGSSGESIQHVELSKKLSGDLEKQRDESRKKLKDAADGKIKMSSEEAQDLLEFINEPTTHRAVIEASLKEGKTIPENVLKEYPDLISLA